MLHLLSYARPWPHRHLFTGRAHDKVPALRHLDYISLCVGGPFESLRPTLWTRKQGLELHIMT